MSRRDRSPRDSTPDTASALTGHGSREEDPERFDECRGDVLDSRTRHDSDLLTDGLRLPRTQDRERISHRGRTYRLRGSETELLATVGAFRVVSAADLGGSTFNDIRSGDPGHLVDQGLLDHRHIVVNDEPTTVVFLTQDGKDLLESYKEPRPHARAQAYHAGLVKPREIAHDVQLHRLFKAESARIRASGGAVRRVVLDYELKRDYQRFLNRQDRPRDTTTEEEREAFARLSELPIVDGHLELPDLRVEYETADGVLAYRDAELVTEHYSRGQLTGKSAAGFILYSAVAPGSRSTNSGTHGTPFDPHHLEWLG